jgi:type IV fimbrial biogenesis protein FimT
MTELVVTLSVAGILAAVAVPSFSQLIASQRAKATGSELFGAMLQTRSSAIARNASITVSQNTGGWNQGWQILDPNGNAIDNHGAAPGITITGPAAVTFRPSGRVQNGAAPMFVVTAFSGSTVSYECVSLGLNGRPYMAAAPTC